VANPAAAHYISAWQDEVWLERIKRRQEKELQTLLSYEYRKQLIKKVRHSGGPDAR
jgi:hypothetical protein